MPNIILETKLVGLITGKFEIPSYQRGYRWGTEEVTRLLNDVYKNGQNNYCLQPIVVRKAQDKYVLIDGQQRLTTLYLIYRYMNKNSFGFISEPKFSLEYVTRLKSAEYLADINEDRKDENIDFWYMFNAYQAISDWFEATKDKGTFQSVLTNINKYFDENVKVIWYEVDCDENEEIKLFERLNIGKIPLTSAELVKAMFLSKDNNYGMTNEKQEEIALQWDNIEKELNNESLWYFLNNEDINRYQTKIDLVLDLIADKNNSREKYYTYFALDRKREEYDQEKKDGKSTEEAIDRLWNEIQKSFLILKDWSENHELYHKIGYLIASKTKTVAQLYKDSYNKNKDEFINDLDTYIKESIDIPDNYADLSYEKSQEKSKIQKLLLLFNVESVRQNGEQTQWFPFDKFKNQKEHKASWSLEHIHAQNSEGMKNEEHWREWLRLHVNSIKAIAENQSDTQLLTDINFALNKTRLERSEFEKIQEKVVERLSLSGSVKYEHNISNLALLNTSDNAALNNSTFDVKRNEIIRMDKEGQYIPFCTKMVFLKYYTPSDVNQLHFWGQNDRVAYVQYINNILKNYLSEAISIGSEDE